MILTTTFIPSQRAKDLLCALWVEYGCWGDTRPILIELRAELGANEFGRFEHDMLRLMNRNSARKSVERILREAVLRSPHKLETTRLPIKSQNRCSAEEEDRRYLKQLRTIHQPA
jgi:hypothetical protein